MTRTAYDSTNTQSGQRNNAERSAMNQPRSGERLQPTACPELAEGAQAVGFAELNEQAPKGREQERQANHRVLLVVLTLLAFSLGCARHAATANSALKPTAYGAAIVESSGGKQTAEVGTPLAQPVIVQVNDDQGNGITGALVTMRGPNGVAFDPASGLTDSSGQFTTNVSLGTIPGRYQLTASTTTKAGKPADLKIEEIALGYQEVVGSQLNDQYCARCHNQESTPERVSNYDNLEVKPHPFTEGDTLNKMSDADLTAIISHGGPALNKSALMPPYGYTLSKSDIQALIAYIRLVSDPPYGAPGIVYAQK